MSNISSLSYIENIRDGINKVSKKWKDEHVSVSNASNLDEQNVDLF